MRHRDGGAHERGGALCRLDARLRRGRRHKAYSSHDRNAIHVAKGTDRPRMAS